MTTHLSTKIKKDRATDEVIGLCRGILADGEVNEQEAKFLLDWINRSAPIDEYPFNILRDRISTVLLDGVLDDDEQLELIDLFMKIIGEPVIRVEDRPDLSFRSSAPATPFTMEKINEIKGKVITLTGEFELGKRSEIVQLIENKGAVFKKSLTKKTEYLVIGNIGSEHWRHSSFGRKIESALKYKQQGVSIEIIAESCLVEHIT